MKQYYFKKKRFLLQKSFLIAIAFCSSFCMEPPGSKPQGLLALPADILLDKIPRTLVRQEKNPESAVKTLYRFFSMNRQMRELLKFDPKYNAFLATLLHAEFGDDLCHMAAILNTPAADHWYSKQSLSNQNCIVSNEDLFNTISSINKLGFIHQMLDIRQHINACQRGPLVLRDGLAALQGNTLQYKALEFTLNQYLTLESYRSCILADVAKHAQQRPGIEQTLYHIMGYTLCLRYCYTYDPKRVINQRFIKIKDFPVFFSFLGLSYTSSCPETMLRAAIKAYCGDNVPLFADSVVQRPLVTTPLHNAIGERNVTGLRLLLREYEADPNYNTPAISPPLHFASWYGNTAVLELLLRFGADINFVYRGQTPLQRAIQQRQLEAVKFFYQNGGRTGTLEPLVFARRVYNEDRATNNSKQQEKNSEVLKYLRQATQK